MKNLPFWLPTKKNLVWYFLFIGLFLLSLDFWMWGQSKPLMLGLPFWMWYLFVLTISLAVVYYVFTRLYWREEE